MVLVPSWAVLVLAAACVAPGSSSVTTPATARLAAETAAVVLFSSRLPRSRSATARDTEFRDAWDEPGRNCGLLMP